MAVIQDLLLELLRRILELMTDERDTWPSHRHFCLTSLVNRAWRKPSQALLFYNLDPGSRVYTLVGTLPSNAGSTLKTVESLELLGFGTVYIKDLVTSLRAPLAVLATELASGWKDGGNVVAELAAILELPVMTKLKRWRLDDSRDWGTRLSEDEKAQWEKSCRARGVEPRDLRRFFTEVLSNTEKEPKLEP
ncbi:hypothetical protein BCR35DRAFT_332246 [Leucosporidium creatinivorum]|uniref:Uncharacterized protein n=1 Tax=Leucosporidium creatinivorum TaxID=106004 RepID=A0A1Y2F4X5_9BASI|nr:hypothetical protein BCR35DRAFT_332246 [Leucosporidium creatinivorum]